MTEAIIIAAALLWIGLVRYVLFPLGRFMADNELRARQQFETHGRERLGLPATDPERRTRAFLAASNSRARRANAYRTDKDAPATLERPGA